jgi:hypothetical protein
MATSRKTPPGIKPDKARVRASDGAIIQPDQNRVKAPGGARKVPAKTVVRKTPTNPIQKTARKTASKTASEKPNKGTQFEVPVSKRVKVTAGSAAPSIRQSLDAWAPDGTPKNPKPANFQIDAEIHSQFKAYAARHRTTMGRLLCALVARELDSEES